MRVRARARRDCALTSHPCTALPPPPPHTPIHSFRYFNFVDEATAAAACAPLHDAFPGTKARGRTRDGAMPADANRGRNTVALDQVPLFKKKDRVEAEMVALAADGRVVRFDSFGSSNKGRCG